MRCAFLVLEFVQRARVSQLAQELPDDLRDALLDVGSFEFCGGSSHSESHSLGVATEKSCGQAPEFFEAITRIPHVQSFACDEPLHNWKFLHAMKRMILAARP